MRQREKIRSNSSSEITDRLTEPDNPECKAFKDYFDQNAAREQLSQARHLMGAVTAGDVEGQAIALLDYPVGSTDAGLSVFLGNVR